MGFTFCEAYNEDVDNSRVIAADATTQSSTGQQASQWTFLTNHAHVLLCIARNPGIRLRDVANAVGITERAAQRIVADLEAAGYLSHTKIGRRNQYKIHVHRPFRHPIEHGHEIGELLAVLAEKPRTAG